MLIAWVDRICAKGCAAESWTEDSFVRKRHVASSVTTQYTAASLPLLTAENAYSFDEQ